TRNDVVLRNNFGIVERVDAQVDWPACRTERSKRSFQIVLQGYIKKRLQRAESDSRGGRISRVRLDQQCRTIAAQEIAAEIFRNGDHKLYPTADEQIVLLGFGFDFPDKIEVGAVLHRIDQRPPLRAMTGKKHGGREMPRIEINGEAEEG